MESLIFIIIFFFFVETDQLRGNKFQLRKKRGKKGGGGERDHGSIGKFGVSPPLEFALWTHFRKSEV